jgi:prepilin-type N-terminal cleavage/methylation domain-containing protein
MSINHLSSHQNKSKKSLGSRGFTIIELSIATLVFSIILIVVTAGIIQFTNQYYKGLTASSTQTTARAISDAITQDIQFSPATTNSVTETPTPGSVSPPYAFCAGGHLYSYQLGKQVSKSGTGTQNKVFHALVEDTNPPVSACGGGTPTAESLSSQTLTGANSPSTEREMLDPNMRLADLSVKNTVGTNLYVVTVRVVYGDDDLLTNSSNDPTAANAVCKGQAGSQFCATSELTTTVQKRL